MHGLHCGATLSNPIRRRTASQPDHRRKARTGTDRKSWADQQLTYAQTMTAQDQPTTTAQSLPIGGSRLSTLVYSLRSPRRILAKGPLAAKPRRRLGCSTLTFHITA